MGRRLPDPIEKWPNESDEEFVTRQAKSKRQFQIFKRIFRSYYLWASLRETGEVGDVLIIEGVEFYFGDLLTGIDTLPRRQRQAFELICMRGYTESAATAILLPNSRWSTPVQQYSDDGLRKMIAAYYAKQEGRWDPLATTRRRASRRNGVVVTSTIESPTVSETDGHRRWDWTSWSRDHESLAAFINAETGLAITPAQVKAVSFLRKPWWASPEEETERQRRRDEREAEKAKFAYETSDQRRKRFAANRALKSQERKLAEANKLLDEVRKLRAEAGLDPETGEPVST